MSKVSDDIAGRLQLFPGQALPTIASSRPSLVARVAVGRPAETLPALMGALHSLCAMPHRLASAAAVAAASGQAIEPTPEQRQLLRASQAREQLLRIAHDWPRLWPGFGAAPEVAAALGACPLWQPGIGPAAQMQALPGWLHTHWLQADPEAWLAAQQRDPLPFAAQWCHASRAPLARTLAALHADATRLQTPPAAAHRGALDVLDDVDCALPLLAQRMLDEDAFCARPDWQGRSAETGPWTRFNAGAQPPPADAWQRLLGRVVDLLHLALPGGERWLTQGALSLGVGQAVAWIEMARGLLVHAVVLERDLQRVAACRVLAPTEWNFHPHGGLAQALSTLRDEGAADDARRLAVAFDPCVAFDVMPARRGEVAHA